MVIILINKIISVKQELFQIVKFINKIKIFVQNVKINIFYKMVFVYNINNFYNVKYFLKQFKIIVTNVNNLILNLK